MDFYKYAATAGDADRHLIEFYNRLA